MGNPMSKAMNEQLEKNQEFMLRTQRMQMERQIMMQNVMRERMMAMQMARARDMFMWYSSFYGVAAVLTLIGTVKTRKPGVFVPIIPLSFILGYQYDLAHGTKIERMKEEAERILKEELSLLDLPQGVPTFDDIENARLALKK
ncbi:plasminogen receptor (KT)-like [Saccoglossus kowalevskii]|uniref:Plasminogen receptor (KT)-like n=1 Tax=Saccoglossus kowalevskii TaxID=10224 RepID=A0ABM0GSG3_SACKO|nr:PREDICTED: plasminogen receptor (KT)-like [Saccoglossus kowalevskii]